MGRLYRRGRIWYGDWEDAQGERQRKSLRTTDRRVARQRLHAAELATTDRASNQGAGLVMAIDWAMAETANPHTSKSYGQKARHLVRLLGDGDVNNLGRDAVSQYIATRKTEGANPNTVHKELVVLRLALKQARNRGLFRGDIAAIVPAIRKPYTPRQRFLTTAEFSALLAELEPHRQLWVALSVYTGANLSEVEKIRRQDVGPDSIHIRGTKRETRDRWVPIAAALRPWLEGATLPVQHWGNCRRDLAAACRRAKIEPVTSNDLRRTFCSWLIQAGADILAVSRLMGHSSTRMVEQVYAQLTQDNYRAAIDLMPRPVLRGVE